MAQAQLLPAVPCPFSFKNHEIRTIQEDDGTLWFAAKDVCAALGIGWNGTTLTNIPTEWQGMRSFRTPSGNQRLRALQEPGVYKLAFRSNKEDADEFTNWIASDVVPSIRKTGQYTSPLTSAHTPTLDTATRLSRRTDPERKALTAIINTWVSMAPVHYASARSQVNAHFGVVKVDDLTVEQVKAAIQWVQGKIDALPVALPAPEPAPQEDSQEREIRAKADEMRRLMWKAGGIMRELRDVVLREHARVRPNDLDTMLLTNDLHEANEKAFRAFENLADTIAYNVMAIRKMVKTRG